MQYNVAIWAIVQHKQVKHNTNQNIMLKQIINGKILTPQGWMKDGSDIIRDNKILEVTNCDLAVIGAEVIDATVCT